MTHFSFQTPAHWHIPLPSGTLALTLLALLGNVMLWGGAQAQTLAPSPVASPAVQPSTQQPGTQQPTTQPSSTATPVPTLPPLDVPALPITLPLPTTVQPSTSQPSTSQPSTVQPSTTQPTTTPATIPTVTPPISVPLPATPTPPVIVPSPVQTNPSQSSPNPSTVTPPTVTPVLQPPTVRNGVRGLWVDGFGPGLKTPAQVAQMVEDARRLGVNTLFVQTIRRADCLCLRSSVPRVADADLPAGFDPLAEVIRLAHAQNMRVIAWVSVTGAGSASAPNPSALHVLHLHGPAALTQSWVNRRADGTYLEGGDIWLDAGIPAASDYMAQGILSLVKNYDIDGIQFDRIRYPDGGNWGYSPAALWRYRAETGAKGVPSPTDPQWLEWRRAQITGLVRRVALEARILKPNIWITAATITYGAPPSDLAGFQKSRTYNDVAQNWPEWTLSGLLDLNVLMNYKQDALPSHMAWFDGWNAFALKVAGQADVAAGTALYLNTPAVSRAQMTRALAAGLGWVGYAYRTPSVDVYKAGLPLGQGLSQLGKALHEGGGPLQSLGWQAAPPPRYGLLGRLRGVAIGGRLVEARDVSGKVLATCLTDGNGYYGFADLGAGVVDVRVAGQRWATTLLHPGVVRLPDLLVREVSIVPPLPSVSVGVR